MAQEHTRGRRIAFETEPLTGLHWAAIGLAALTGAIHLYLYVSEGFIPFLLAGAGFFGAVGLVLIGFYRRIVYLVGIPYTMAQIAGWYVLDGNFTAIAIVDKAAQVLLIALLAYLFVREGREGEPSL